MSRVLEKEITISGAAVAPSFSGLKFKEGWNYEIEKCLITGGFVYREWKEGDE